MNTLIEEKDTQDWLMILAGQPVADAHPDTLREAEALREVLQCRQHPPRLTSRVLNNVLKKSRKEKVDPPSILKVLSEMWYWRMGLAIACSFVLVIILRPLYWSTETPELTVKGGLKVCSLKAIQPQTKVEELQRALTQLGMKTQIDSRGENRRLTVVGVTEKDQAKLAVWFTQQCPEWGPPVGWEVIIEKAN